MEWKTIRMPSVSESCSHENLLFLDADVKLHPQGIFAYCSTEIKIKSIFSALFPRQVTGTTLEDGSYR